MMFESSWNDMLDEFRAVGGTAENICLKEGAFGRGLFPADSAKPIKIHIPDSLLIDLNHAEFDENNVFHVSPTAQIGQREKVFLENYERDFSWGTGRADTERLLQAMHSAPPALRQLLHTPFEAERWLAEPTPKAVQFAFFGSRVIAYKGRNVIMPIVELANHGHLTRYNVTDGVGLSGQFSDEILVQYEFDDSWALFAKWGFASEEPFALSLPLTIQSKSASIVIRRNVGAVASAQKPFFPEVTVSGNTIDLAFMLLGSRQFPRLARGNFQRIMRDAGHADANEAFDMIQHINRMQFFELIALSEGAAPLLRDVLRKVALFQLRAMSHNVGTRDV
ncbi:MAG: hypothetical protein ACJ8IR_13315 [Alphaproteobacteria bacterium]|jgi:hypothetical protein